MDGHHLAQLNVARFAAGLDPALLAAFTDKLDEVNAVADAPPGFVWRLMDESGNATEIKAFDDPRMLVNMSVWESIEALREFTYKSGHIDVFIRRKDWFTPLDGPHQVMWWIPEGTIPSLEDAQYRLALLRDQGPCADAFTFKKKFLAPALVA